jgi:hypothetical protein
MAIAYSITLKSMKTIQLSRTNHTNYKTKNGQRKQLQMPPSHNNSSPNTTLQQQTSKHMHNPSLTEERKKKKIKISKNKMITHIKKAH